MTLYQILSLIGALGLGGLIGIVLKSFFDYRMANRRMLFEARVKAYTGITGRVFNLFQELDIQRLPDEVKFTKLNELLSGVMLMASHELAEHIGQFKTKVYEFHIALGKENDSEAGEFHKELVALVGKIHDQMRKDLHVDNKSVFED